MMEKKKKKNRAFGAGWRLFLLQYDQKLPKFNVNSSLEQKNQFLRSTDSKNQKIKKEIRQTPQIWNFKAKYFDLGASRAKSM